MNKRQEVIKSEIKAAVRASGQTEVVYKSEWLGYLPFGVYHWMECAGSDFTRDFPSGWSHDDISGLEQAGFLEKLDEYKNPDDEFDITMTYRVHLKP